MSDRTARPLGHGFYWRELNVGDRFRTFKRTITEADLINFISVTGMLEELFIDATYEGGAVTGRLVPAALTYSLIEGMLLQTMIQGTGLVLLEASMKARGPVRVGDTIFANVTVSGIRPTSQHNRAIVSSEVEILNQAGAAVLTYTVVRMIAGRPAEQ